LVLPKQQVTQNGITKLMEKIGHNLMLLITNVEPEQIKVQSILKHQDGH